jgi:hypothetical protein
MNWEQLVSMWIGRVILCSGGLLLASSLAGMAVNYIFRQMHAGAAFVDFLIDRKWTSRPDFWSRIAAVAAFVAGVAAASIFWRAQ